ncbi:PHP domain-like protein [Exidia glandulosa HHB12029]|uniref:PHP domain-like protein n=1 Tax=Exidia glandulosa HHB12029 TaxID=1314781 RepID=A0A165NYP3_EXIGL|nr:PHP domain-like protein [Exidia glandulosa HHB12029]
MFFELDVPVPEPALSPPPGASSSGGGGKKGKQKATTATQPQQEKAAPPLLFNAAQIASIEARIELLAQLGYSVLVLSQTVRAPIDTRNFVNVLAGLLPVLKRPPGVVLASRLTMVLDSDCDSSFGLAQANLSLFEPYDILALRPLTPATFSSACIAHSLPSQLTAHIISIPLSPRIPYPLKHTLVRTARKNGVVFELCGAGAVKGEEGWWGSAREVVRVSKGRNVVLSGGGEARAPRDWSNIGSLIDLTREQAHDAVTSVARSVLIRARSRKTYRSVLSAPKLIVPGIAPEPDHLADALDQPAAAASDSEDSDEEEGAVAGKRKREGGGGGGGRKKKKKKR